MIEEDEDLSIDFDEEDEDELEEEEDALVQPAATAEIVVQTRDEGMRLDRFLREQLPGRSRALLQKHIDRGAVKIEGEVPRRGARTLVHAGAIIQYTPPPPEVIDLVPEDIPLSILYEDEHLLVIDKQRDLVVHPAPGHPRGTLVNAVLHHLRRAGRPGADTLRPGIVHRLDRNTTGAILVAKSEAIHDALARAFQERRVEKQYVAVTIGVPKPPERTIDTLYGRHPRDRKRFTSRVREGKRAITHYAVKETFPGAALVGVTLETGRTHQIRVHLAEIGHPLAGDTVYGSKRQLERAQRAIAAFDRPALHAQRLGFVHPVTGGRINVVAPTPRDLAELLQALREAERGGP